MEDHDDPMLRLQSTEAALELFAVGEGGTGVGLCRFGHGCRGQDLECLVVPVPCRLDELSLHRPPRVAGRSG